MKNVKLLKLLNKMVREIKILLKKLKIQKYLQNNIINIIIITILIKLQRNTYIKLFINVLYY